MTIHSATASRRGRSADELLERVEGVTNVLDRVRVREPQMVLAVDTERRTRKTGHAGLVQQPIGKRGGRHPQLADVRERVERAAGLETGNPRYGVQPGHDHLTPFAERLEHPVNVIPGSFQRGDRGMLAEG